MQSRQFEGSGLNRLTSEITAQNLNDRQTIAKGSKSFYLASLFFTGEQRTGSWHLYRWCRYCDDLIDDAPSKEVSRRRLGELKEQTIQAIDEDHASTSEFEGLAKISRLYRIPKAYPLDLVKGLEMDVADFRYETLADVELYAYRVAGVVGLMMCYIMGVTNSAAHPHAVALGNAMQLTNIARDVAEDAERGRVYLPQEWLATGQTYPAVLKLLDRADELYRIGYRGLRYLPFRAALAVSIAGSIYAAIGHKIKAGGPTQLTRRTVVSFPHKLILVLVGSGRVLKSYFSFKGRAANE